MTMMQAQKEEAKEAPQRKGNQRAGIMQAQKEQAKEAPKRKGNQRAVRANGPKEGATMESGKAIGTHGVGAGPTESGTTTAEMQSREEGTTVVVERGVRAPRLANSPLKLQMLVVLGPFPQRKSRALYMVSLGLLLLQTAATSTQWLLLLQTTASSTQWLLLVQASASSTQWVTTCTHIHIRE